MNGIPEDDQTPMRAVGKNQPEAGVLFWSILLTGPLLALILPMWVKICLAIAKFSWGLIG